MELGLLESSQIRPLKWTALKVSSQVDRRSAVNPRQARALLEAVRARQPSRLTRHHATAFPGSRRSWVHDPAVCLPVPGRPGSGRRLAGSLIPDRTPWSAIGSSSKRGMTCRWGWSPP